MSAKPQCCELEKIPSQNLDLLKHPRASTVKASAHRRDRHEILAEILEAARGGAIKTHIMYKARLSYQQLNDYLPLLLEKGFLENPMIKRNRKTTYVWRTSEKGTRFLENFRLFEV